MIHLQLRQPAGTMLLTCMLAVAGPIAACGGPAPAPPMGVYGLTNTNKWGKTENQLLIDYWKECIHIFYNAFPELPLGLAVTDAFGRVPSGKPGWNYVIPRQVLEFAVEETERRQITIMPVGLWVDKAPVLRSRAHPRVQTLRMYRDRMPVGIRGGMRTPDLKTLTEVLDFAGEGAISRVELWHSDVLRSEFQDTLRTYDERLRSGSSGIRGDVGTRSGDTGR